ncbi:MAG: GTPase Era [Lewinellaceae bacterium]|nr:GTPase Era [Lewinellaceae bacterium]
MKEEKDNNTKPAVPFRSGFVNIIGKPNVGKSTLMNALVGERMSIITHKPQTTRHRIIGILSGEHYQIVFSDTPGYVRDPAYKMHRAMNRFVEGTLEDADLMVAVVDLTDALEEDHPVLEVLQKVTAPIFLVLNKTDLVNEHQALEADAWWSARIKTSGVARISALNEEHAEQLLQLIVAALPEGPPYYPPEQLTDRPERFFVTEIIREKILLQYADEIPYACEVGIEMFEETKTTKGEPLAKIYAYIYVLRDTQKAIVLGKNGSAIKKLGTEARKDIEKFLDSKVFLDLTVKVRKNWRDDDKALQRFGYLQ